MLQFILGNSGAGKSHYLYEKIIQESMKHPEINYLVIVPEQFTMQTQQDLCILHPNHGIMNIDVLSFGRMAHRIFEEVGQSRGQVLDDEGKNLILRKIAGQYEDRLRVLKGNLKKGWKLRGGISYARSNWGVAKMSPNGSKIKVAGGSGFLAVALAENIKTGQRERIHIYFK